MRILVCLGVVIGLLCAATTALPREVDGRPATERIARLVAQLGDDDFAVREAAGEELAEIGEGALVALRGAVAAEDLEVRRRAEDVVQTIGQRRSGISELGIADC